MTLSLFLLSAAFVPLFSPTQGSCDLAAPSFGSWTMMPGLLPCY
jgi:hypothetical protein